ncbi:MAG: hypothetical protein RLZZ227_104 [Pseudomonadota bacterium]
MKLMFTFISAFLLSSAALAQSMVIQSRPSNPVEILPSQSSALTQSVRTDMRPLEGMGRVPESTFELVASSDLVVRGRWGKLLQSQNFLGYGTNPEEFQSEHRLTDRQLQQAGLPANDHEILIDEVLMGEVRGKTIVLRTLESPGAEKRSDIAEFREGTHLLFLALQPDGTTYALQGTRYDQKETSNGYVFLEHRKIKTFTDASDKVAFEREIHEVLTENAGKLGIPMR